MTQDLALQLLRRGYHALPRAHHEHGGVDVFATTVAGQRAVVVRGREGARLFYDDRVVQREGAVPPPLADLLFGRGAVHGTDGTQHRIRKQMFLDVLDTDRVEELAVTIGRDLERRVAGWPGREVVVFDELVEVYGAAVQAWSGVVAGPQRTRRTSHRLAAIVGGTAVEPGDLLVLDVPGTNQHPDHWDEPERFLPERFADLMPDAFAFVPQGGGDPRTGHRCPGEPLTVRILEETARVLATVDYAAVTDTAHDPTRIPTLPARGLPVRVTAPG